MEKTINKMTIKQIDELVKRKDELTGPEKLRLANAILKNKKAKEIAINGAASMGDELLAVRIHFCKKL